MLINADDKKEYAESILSEMLSSYMTGYTQEAEAKRCAIIAINTRLSTLECLKYFINTYKSDDIENDIDEYISESKNAIEYLKKKSV